MSVYTEKKNYPDTIIDYKAATSAEAIKNLTASAYDLFERIIKFMMR